MSSKVNHNNRTSRIKYFNKANFNSMVRRKKVRDYYFGTPYKMTGARAFDTEKGKALVDGLNDEPKETED